MERTFVCTTVDGVCELRRVPVESWSTAELEIARSVFNCPDCALENTGLGSRSGFGDGNVSFCLYYSDPHVDVETCAMGTNVAAPALLHARCGCGYEKECRTYRGEIYWAKYDVSGDQGPYPAMDCIAADVARVQTHVDASILAYSNGGALTATHNDDDNSNSGCCVL